MSLHLEFQLKLGESDNLEFGTLKVLDELYLKLGICSHILGAIGRSVESSSSSLITPDVFKLVGSYESSGYPLSMAVWSVW